jgi:membrane peptidoglycan carboxypeptidase
MGLDDDGRPGVTVWRGLGRPLRPLRQLVASGRFRTVVRWTSRVTLALMLTATLLVSLYYNSIALPTDPIAPQASQIFYSDGTTLLATIGISSRTDVPLDQIPLPVRQAVLAAEDRGFYQHFGISLTGVVRAAWSDVSGGSEGASTITQQYVRNAYLTQERTVDRKAKEMVLAVKLEQRYSKDEILDHYLNAIYFGRGAYGIAAAANAYFGVPVSQLTIAQGAVLAAVIKDPTNFDPSVGPADARARWQWIIDSMRQLGWLGPDPVDYPQVLVEAPKDTTPAGVNGLIVGLVERELVGQGISSQVLHTAGLRIVTTIDVHAQQAALSAVAHSRSQLDPAIHAALVAIDPLNGGILAYYGGDRGAGYYDDATAPRRPASTFKPITLAAALQRDIAYTSTWDGRSPRAFPDRFGAPLHNENDQQCPVCPLDEAMVRSLNTPFYALAERLGGSTVRALAIELGISPTYDDQPSLVDGRGDPRPGYTRADITLGAYPVSPADLATVYATFAANGVRADRHVVALVRDHDDQETWYTAHSQRVVVLDPRVADDVSTVLGEVVDQNRILADRPAAGKTGTQQWGDTQDNQDAWMAGYTPQIAAVVWVGRPVPGPIRTAQNVPIEGLNVPATIWRDFLDGALQGRPVLDLPPPAHLGSDVGDATVPVETVTPTTPTPSQTPDPQPGPKPGPKPSAPSSGSPTTSPSTGPTGNPSPDPTTSP